MPESCHASQLDDAREARNLAFCKNNKVQQGS
jgi:hypothetical protein